MVRAHRYDSARADRSLFMIAITLMVLFKTLSRVRPALRYLPFSVAYILKHLCATPYKCDEKNVFMVRKCSFTAGHT